MNCLKCGREISEDEVFCVDCQLEAQRYPVNPNTAIFLPPRKKQDPAKKPVKRRTIPAEELIKSYRRRLSLVTIALVIAVLIILALLYPAVSYMTKEHYVKGQNYTPMTTVPPSPATTEATVPVTE